MRRRPHDRTEAVALFRAEEEVVFALRATNLVAAGPCAGDEVAKMSVEEYAVGHTGRKSLCLPWAAASLLHGFRAPRMLLTYLALASMYGQIGHTSFDHAWICSSSGQVIEVQPLCRA
jgi:hypothetical protein